MITINYLDLMDPTIAAFLEDNQVDRAIDVSKKVLAVAQEDWNNGAFGHAEEVSKAYFQLSLVYSVLGKDKEAAEAAKQAFLYDHFLFNQYIPIITALLKVEEPEMDDIAAKAFQFFSVGLDEFHGDSDSYEILLELIKEHKDRSRELYRAYQYDEYRSLMQKTNDDPEYYNKALEFIDEWEKEGVDILECDGLRCVVYYYQDRESDVVKLWENRSLSDAPSIIICTYIALSMITEGVELPEKIVFPDDYNVVKWSLASSIVYRRIRPLVADSGLTDEIKKVLDEKEKQKVFFYKCVSLARQIAEEGVAIYEKFFNGEVNGSATSPFQYANFLDTQGELLGKTGQRAAGLAILQKGMDVCPHDRFAASIVDLAIDMGNGEIALSALQWRRNNLEQDDLVWEKTHFLDRLERWAHGLLCESFEEYEKYINIYDKKYKELNRVMRSSVSSLLIFVYYRFEGEKKEYIYANNNNSMVLNRLFKREPFNKKLIAALLQAYAKNPSERSDLFIKENMGLIDVLRENVVTSEDKRYLCQGLASFGFLLSVFTEEDNEDETDIFINDQALWEQGVALLDEAMEYAQDDLQREQILVYKISLYWVVDRWEEILELCKKGLELLENEEIKELPENFFLKRWRANEYELADFPIALFAFYSGRMFQCAENLNRSREELIYFARKAFSYNNPHPYMEYKLAKLLLPQALKDPNSKEYQECLDLTYDYLQCYADDPDDEERGELLYVMGQLAIAKKHLRYAQYLLQLLESDYENSEDIEPFKKLCDSTYRDLYKTKKLLIEKNSERGEEAMKRRERSVKLLKQENHLLVDSPYVETIDTMRVRKAEDVIRRMIIFSKISSMAKRVLDRDEFDSEAFENNIEEIKSLGLYDSLDSLEYCFLDRYADRSSLITLTNCSNYIMPCAWLLGLVEIKNLFDLKEAHHYHFVSKFERNGHLLLEGELRSPKEILDQLDYVFMLFKSLTAQFDLLEEESPEIEPMSNKIEYVLYWLTLLDWAVDFNGFNQWRYVKI